MIAPWVVETVTSAHTAVLLDPAASPPVGGELEHEMSSLG